MNLSDEQWEFLKDVARLILYIELEGDKATGGELERNEYMQQYYLGMGLTTTLKSMHLKKCAIDLNIFMKNKNGKLVYVTSKDKIQKYGDFWESLNSKNVWGGNWKFMDTPHFQRTV